MNIFKKFRIGPVWIYISSRRMQRKRSADEIYQYNRDCIRKEKHRRWVENGGHCEKCGLKLPEDRLTMHHVIPLKQRPDLVSKPSNMLMVCQHCHDIIHGFNPPRPA